MNWRNTIVNTRSFGNDTEKVIENVRAYIKGIKDANPNMACTCKHFPGDGVDELDPHLVLAQNTLSVEEWENTFGKVYQTLIDEGLESIMIGQIALPEMSKKLRPGITGRDIMPASLAPELLNDLLREQMGFNGVIVSDASHMIGMSAVMKREDAVPLCIAAGCDMFLFTNDVEEDMGFFKAGLERGIVTEERFSDALHRIIGMKAHLKLYRDVIRFVDEKYINEWIGTEEHHEYTRQAAEECITLVKDTASILPICVEEKKKALLVYVHSTPNSKAYTGDPVRGVITEELEAMGFEVTQAPNYYDLEVQNGISPMNFIKMLNSESRAAFKQKYDVVFLFINVRGYAQENVVRMRWSCNHSCEMPWYVEEVPTVAVSLNYTNHLIDIPQVHTFVNAYGENRENIHAAIGKICGKSEFKGTANDTVFCGREDTRY
jgi:beta-N-acetylhexosaminidase